MTDRRAHRRVPLEQKKAEEKAEKAEEKNDDKAKGDVNVTDTSCKSSRGSGSRRALG